MPDDSETGSLPIAGETLSADFSAEQLARLAEEHPDRWDEIWHHPNCYDGLREWMSQRYEEQQASAQQLVQATGQLATSPGIEVETKQKKRLPIALIAGLSAVALVAIAGGIGLGMSGVLSGLFGGGKDAASFDQGIERMWVADSNDYVIPTRGELGQDFSYLRSAFSRGSIALFEADYPAATKSAVAFSARGEDSRLIVLSARDGSTLVDYDLEGRRANCVADGFDSQTEFVCVASGGDSEGSVVLRVNRAWEVSAQHFDARFDRAAVFGSRIVVAGNGGVAVEIDHSGKVFWQRDDLMNGAFAGIDMSENQTLIRGYEGWTLLGESGETLAQAAVVGPYDNGDGECDARLTQGGHLFVATNNADCVQNNAGIHWLSQPGSLTGKHIFSVAGRDYLLSQGGFGTEVLRFPQNPGSEFEQVLHLDVPTLLAGTVESEEPAVVLNYAGTVYTYSLEDASELASWPTSFTTDSFAAYLQDPAQLDRSISVIDAKGTVLTRGIAYNAYTGEKLWSVVGGQTVSGLVTPAGILQLGGGCPECSVAGGSYTSSTVTLYSPVGSGGTLVSISAGAETGEQSQDVASNGVSAPSFIPACPNPTILLAWMELEDGWIVVCGVTQGQPSYVAFTPHSGQQTLVSLGSQDPTSQLAQDSVTWDPSLKRFIATMSDGSRLTLDYTTATVTQRADETSSNVQQQQRFVRYVFVPIDTSVRTAADASNESGAFDVKTPEATAQDQVRYMVEVLEKAYEGRAMVKEALPKLIGCKASAGGYQDSIKAMKAVRDNRAELLQALEAMPVDKIPEGTQLLADLTEAIEISHRANVEYVKWAEAANAKGCASLSAAGQAAADASDAPKERFASRWNRVIAGQFGVRTFDDWYI